MMNGKGCGRKRSCPISRYYLSIPMEKLRETTNNFRIISVPAEVRTESTTQI
jgi:hypothetical protein